MSGNRGVVYLGPGKVEVQNIPYPKMQDPQGRQIDHGVILRVVSTNICGSDQHMVRGRTTAPEGLVLGHEITGEVVEIGRGVETMKIGDLVSVPFNVACGHCRTCKEQHTGVCLTVNPARAGGAYGYVDMGGWVGGQAEYVLVPYADFNLLKLPNLRESEKYQGGGRDKVGCTGTDRTIAGWGGENVLPLGKEKPGSFGRVKKAQLIGSALSPVLSNNAVDPVLGDAELPDQFVSIRAIVPLQYMQFQALARQLILDRENKRDAGPAPMQLEHQFL